MSDSIRVPLLTAALNPNQSMHIKTALYILLHVALQTILQVLDLLVVALPVQQVVHLDPATHMMLVALWSLLLEDQQ